MDLWSFQDLDFPSQKAYKLPFLQHFKAYVYQVFQYAIICTLIITTMFITKFILPSL